MIQKKSPNEMELLGLMLQKDPQFVFEKIKSLFKVSQASSENIKKFVALYEEGYIPVMYSNHQSHADGIILSIIIEKILEIQTFGRLRGFLCPVAASMATGDQNVKVQEGTNMFQPFALAHGFISVSVIREVDREKYQMEGSNREAIQRIMYAPRDNYGLAVFPEGTVQGGRLRHNGSIYGMQKVEQGGILLRCVSFWQTLGKQSVLLPIAIENSYQIFNPDSYAISAKVLEMLSENLTMEKLVRVVVGEPVTTEKIEMELASSINAKSQEQIDYFMRKVAVLLPNDARGYYGHADTSQVSIH